MTDTTAPDRLWLRRHHVGAPGAPVLVLLPHAGGSATYFHPLSSALAPAVEAVAVQYPGRQDRLREPLIDSVPALARAVADVLDRWLRALDVPFAILGHSLGASVAYEVTCLLDSDPRTSPSHLVVSSRGAPDDPRNLGIHTWDDARLLGEVGLLSGTADSLLADPEIIASFLPAIRNDYRAAETYVVAEATPVAVPITAITGLDDPRVGHADMAGWERFTTADFRLHTAPGGHFHLTDHPRSAATRLREVIGAASAPVPTASPTSKEWQTP